MAELGITRIARGKLKDDDLEKELDNICKQVETKFLKVGEKNYTFKNYTPLRAIDVNTATLGQVANMLCTILSDLEKGKAIK